MIVLATNVKGITDKLYCQEFLNYPGISSLQVHNEKAERYLKTLHNDLLDRNGIMIINCSERVFVFNPELLWSYMTFLINEGNCEVNGFTKTEGQVDMSDEFNIIFPNTPLTGKRYFAQAHNLGIDSFIAFEACKEAPGILLLDHNRKPFAIYAGTIAHFKSPMPDVMKCYEYAKTNMNERIEHYKTVA